MWLRVRQRVAGGVGSAIVRQGGKCVDADTERGVLRWSGRARVSAHSC